MSLLSRNPPDENLMESSAKGESEETKSSAVRE